MHSNTSIIEKIYHPDGRKIDFKKSGLTVYNIGCGKQEFPGVKGIDWALPEGHTGIQHDLNTRPWPLPENSADVVLAFHFIEHIGDLFETFKEIYRISKNGARVVIEIPHFRSSSAFKDPTHIHFFTAKTINYFCKENHTYTKLPFKYRIIDSSIGWPAPKNSFLKKRVKQWLNTHQDLYDNLLYLLFQAKIMVIELEVEK